MWKTHGEMDISPAELINMPSQTLITFSTINDIIYYNKCIGKISEEYFANAVIKREHSDKPASSDPC